MHVRQSNNHVILFVAETVRRAPPVANEPTPIEPGECDPPDQDPFVQLLRGDGYEVNLAEGTTEAITCLDRSPPPDFFIADIQTPRLDAVFIARYARSRSPLLPIAFVTSYPERLEIAAHELDPNPLLFTKPLDYRHFRIELRRLMRRNSSSLALGNVSYLERPERRSRGSK